MKVFRNVICSLGCFFAVFLTNGQNAYIVGQPVEDSLISLNWTSSGNCHTDGYPDFTIEFDDCMVSGLSHVLILTNVSPVNSVYTDIAGTVNTGDTLNLDGSDHTFYFMGNSTLEGTFKVIGIPEVEGETYLCGEISSVQTLAECWNTFQYYYDTMVAAQCDVKPSCYTEQIYQVTACDSFYWSEDNVTYTNDGLYESVYSNMAGCDSVIKLNLNLNHSVFTEDEINSCKEYTWIDGNTYTSDNNSATYILTNAQGCDSVVTLNLTISNIPPTVDQVFSCADYTWIDGNTYTSSNNTASYTLISADGCDSVVYLDLTINELNALVELTEVPEGIMLSAVDDQMQYQWLDCDDNFSPLPGETSQHFIPSSSGNYALLLSDGDCQDTSECIIVNVSDISLLENEEVHLFPNPNDGVFTVKYPNGQPGELTISDELGRVKYRAEFIEKKFETKLSPGIYFVSLTQNGVNTVKKMVVR
ncbi:MAG: T9SS type A sorting domain-containing protein [Brumimicrobium sp.]|nr:T9SS type A sorting domain-containing protein [Brumimicrobium sp.]